MGFTEVFLWRKIYYKIEIKNTIIIYLISFGFMKIDIGVMAQRENRIPDE